MGDHAAASGELVDAGASHVGSTRHVHVVGHGEQERALVGVALAQHRLDLQRGAARLGAIDDRAVVHHAFEHRERSDPQRSSSRPRPGGTIDASWQTSAILGPVPDDDPTDAAALARYASELADGVDALLPGWVERVVAERCEAAGRAMTDEDRVRARAAGEEARVDVGGRVRALLARDVDDQPTGPLALLRTAVRHPTAVLAVAGVPAVERDEVARRLHPDDPYDLTPAAFADISPALHEPGLVWGAAKAHVVLARRRREGLR